MDKLDFEIFEFNKECFLSLDLFQTTEQRVMGWLHNERCRSIFSRQEIINLFKTKHKIQMVKVNKIKLTRYDKLIIWTPKGTYFVLEFKNIYK